MSKHFRSWKIDRPQLLPADVREYVAKGHMARFIVSLVVETLDLTDINSAHPSVLGQPPFDPRLMVALLLHACASGIYASREAEGRRRPGTEPAPVSEVPDGKAQKNFSPRT